MSHQIQLDLSHFSTATSLHEGLAAVLGFPGYYGKNWDAFDECIADQEVPCPDGLELVLYNMQVLEERLPREAALFRDCLMTATRKRPSFKYRFGSSQD